MTHTHLRCRRGLHYSVNLRIQTYTGPRFYYNMENSPQIIGGCIRRIFVQCSLLYVRVVGSRREVCRASRGAESVAGS